MDIRIVRSPKRKTIALQILPDASVTVRVPWLLPKRLIDDFLQTHQEWIKEKQEVTRKKNTSLTQKQFITGEQFLYLGNAYPLVISNEIHTPLVFKNGFYLNAFNRNNAETYFINWYKKQALRFFSQKVSVYAKQVKLRYSDITLSSATSKWGSCSYDNELMFNWRLIMASIPVIDSVIFHELAHIMEKNHTKRFWRKVHMWFPDYAKHHAWLDNNGHTLVL